MKITYSTPNRWFLSGFTLIITAFVLIIPWSSVPLIHTIEVSGVIGLLAIMGVWMFWKDYRPSTDSRAAVGLMVVWTLVGALHLAEVLRTLL